MMSRSLNARSAWSGGASESSGQAPDVESASAQYAARFEGSVGRWLLDVQSEGVERLMGDASVDRILEVGGGHAQLAAVLRPRCGLLIEQGSERGCALRLRALTGTIPFVESDLERLPFADRSVDLVVAVRLLAHVSRPDAFLAECARVAERSILVDFPSWRSVNALTGLLFGWKRSVEHDTRPYRLYRPGEVEDLLKPHGFLFATAFPQFFWPMVLHRMIGHVDISRFLEWVPRRLGVTRLVGSPWLALYVRGTDR